MKTDEFKTDFLNKLGYGNDMRVTFEVNNEWCDTPKLINYKIYIFSWLGKKHYKTVECDNADILKLLKLKGFRFDTVYNGNFDMDFVLTND